jgi:hypothetical protein
MIEKIHLWENKTYNNILKNVNIFFKWFKNLQKLMKYLVIYWIWVDCTISITIEIFDSCDFTKNILTNFSFKQT